MSCCRFLSSTPLSAHPVIIIGSNKNLLSDKTTRHLQIAYSYSPPAATYSTKPSIPMDSAPKTQEPTFDFLTKKPYLPTPIHKWNLPDLPKNTEVYIKRDDLSGMQLSGNKVRKLEFLLAEAVAQGADCIITIGGIQSNHCRATAVAARYLNLDCYLILRTSKALVDKDPGLTGNLLVERLVGAHIDLVSKEEYANVGSVALTNTLKEKLLSEGRKPYVIPVGGSNSLGTWGYIEAIREIKEQLKKGNGELAFDDIVSACGRFDPSSDASSHHPMIIFMDLYICVLIIFSGATVAGLAVGSWLSDLRAKVHAYCVCDDPEYFYEFTQGLLDGIQAGIDSRDIVDIQNAKGLGYAINTAEELAFVKQIAQSTGVVLDPVYSGKAAYGMMKDMAENPAKWEGRKVLFIHTGGLLGLYDKTEQMSSLLGNWRRMDIHESVPRKEGTGKMF
ncbi:UNVERIFIED_CONTAM: putative D-cysteine desulfhydrase 1, mitochondrial [Sesamum calycinum]|uniref:D-cysteine desulfhydrase 1, mitochondrial n=1 Tax=Sesamum calycinum TaxID=2727403 RepID=A0AAW2NGP2_9LAMI